MKPTATVTPSEHLAGWSVRTTWDAPVDRPSTHSFFVGADRALAERTAAAINAGLFWSDPEIVTDMEGRTFVAATAFTIGKYLRTDLAKIGF